MLKHTKNRSSLKFQFSKYWIIIVRENEGSEYVSILCVSNFRVLLGFKIPLWMNDF